MLLVSSRVTDSGESMYAAGWAQAEVAKATTSRLSLMCALKVETGALGAKLIGDDQKHAYIGSRGLLGPLVECLQRHGIHSIAPSARAAVWAMWT